MNINFIKIAKPQKTKKLIKNSLILAAGAIATLLISISPKLPVHAQSPSKPSLNPYRPIPINFGTVLEDILTEQDIPTGQKGFARDYIISANQDDRLEVSVNSSSFDTVLSLLDRKGEVIAENDDATSSATNSLIFFRFRESGQYIIRVSSFGGSSGGKFTLQVNRLQVVK